MVELAAMLRVTSLALLGYYLLVNGGYLLIHVAALFNLRTELKKRQWGPMYERFASPFFPGVTIVMPAYNEETVIVESVRSLLNLNYPETELIIVNDGSDDATLATLQDAFDLDPIDAPIPSDIPAAEIRTVYRAPEIPHLTVVDKENGGKADALNAGIWLADQPLCCTVDADSIIDRDGLLHAVRPFLEKPEETVAAGGTVRIANGCTVERGRVTATGLPRNYLAELQTMEYLRSFYSGRLGFDQLDSLLLLSGTFSVFRTDVLRDIGGYATDTVTEDLELVVRLHRTLREAGREYRTEFVPDPIVWTDAPTSLADLSAQRRRWYRGLWDTLVRHRQMFGRPRYGAAGLIGHPVFLFAEALGPLIEGLGYVVVLVAGLFGAVSWTFVLVYFALTAGVGVFLSWFGIFTEVWSFRRFDGPTEIVRLLGDAVLENFGFRQWKTVIKWQALVEYVAGDTSWGEISRSGYDPADQDVES